MVHVPNVIAVLRYRKVNGLKPKGANLIEYSYRSYQERAKTYIRSNSVLDYWRAPHYVFLKNVQFKLNFELFFGKLSKIGPLLKQFKRWFFNNWILVELHSANHIAKQYEFQ